MDNNKEDLSEDPAQNMDRQISQIVRMMRFLGVQRYQLSNFGMNWHESLSKYGQDIQVCFSSFTKMISVMRWVSASKSDYIFIKPTPEIINRCYFSIIADAWQKIVKATEVSDLPFLEQAQIKFYGLDFLNAYEYYGTQQSR